MKLRELIRTGRSAQLVVTFGLPGLSGAGTVFNIARVLNDGLPFNGTLMIDPATVNSNSPILASNISVSGNNVDICLGPQIDGGSAGSDSHPGAIGAASGDASQTAPQSMSKTFTPIECVPGGNGLRSLTITNPKTATAALTRTFGARA